MRTSLWRDKEGKRRNEGTEESPYFVRKVVLRGRASTRHVKGTRGLVRPGSLVLQVGIRCLDVSTQKVSGLLEQVTYWTC